MSAVSSHAATGLYDVVLVKRPKGWHATDTHEVPPQSEVIGVELFGVHEIVAEDLLCEINSSDWLDEWAVMLPHKAETAGPLRIAIIKADGTLNGITEVDDPRTGFCQCFNAGCFGEMYAVPIDGDQLPTLTPELVERLEADAAGERQRIEAIVAEGGVQ